MAGILAAVDSPPRCHKEDLTVSYSLPTTTSGVISLIERHFRHLQEESHLGPQYEWLARMAKQLGVADLELSVHVDDKAAFFLNAKGAAHTGRQMGAKGGVSRNPLGFIRLLSLPIAQVEQDRDAGPQ